MPNPRYTDADLIRFARKPLGIEIVPPGPKRAHADDQPYEPSIDELLNDAQGSLDRAETFANENSTRNLANLPTRMASLSQGERPSVSRAAASITKPMRDVGQGLLMGALPASIPGSPVAGGALASAGVMLSAPDVLRRLAFPQRAETESAIDPSFEDTFGYDDPATDEIEGQIPRGVPDTSEDESRWGAAGEAALLGAPQIFRGAKAGVGAVRTAATNASNARRVAAARSAMTGGPAMPRPASTTAGPSKFALGREVPHQSTVPAVDPNRVMRMAQEIADETGVPVEKVLKGYGNDTPGRQSALGKLVGAGQSGRQSQAVRRFPPALFEKVAHAAGAGREANRFASAVSAEEAAIKGAKMLDVHQVLTMAEDVARETGASVDAALKPYLASIPVKQRAIVQQRLTELIERKKPMQPRFDAFDRMLGRAKELPQTTRDESLAWFNKTAPAADEAPVIIGADTPAAPRGAGRREVIRRQRQLALGQLKAK